jgi:hypothetical protein
MIMSVAIKSVETKPQLDPYHRDTGQATYTVIKLYPEDREIYVVQEYDDNATPSDEWHGLTLTYRVYGWPLEEDMRQWLEQTLPTFARIADGFERVWDGHNYRGRLDDEAHRLDELLRQQLNEGFPWLDGYSFYSAGDWLYDGYAHHITPETTDDQLASWAEDAEAEAEAGHIILDEPAIDWMKRQRDNA